MGTWEWRPVVDITAAGGRALAVELYDTPDRTGTPVATVPAPTGPDAAGRWVFDLPDLPDGRYWGAVQYLPRTGAAQARDRNPRIDLPTDTGLVTSPEEVAVRLDIKLPLSAEQRDRFAQAIEDAQGDVRNYLGRDLAVGYATYPGVSPNWAAARRIDDWRTWRHLVVGDDFDVVAVVDRGHGLYDVTVRTGLEPEAETAVRRYVTAHAGEALRSRGSDGTRRTTSVSAEGQSVSYEATPTTGQPGSLPSLEDLAPYRAMPVGSPPRIHRMPWPYS
ncbi:hypothetical protein [Actinacidiphila sp. bgisy160]|uniref:hypothetical protein n=1 Tax=Actinacidiphila sp. bgisy160 TaxID=3413796 RepID=UPI003D74D1AC